MIDDKLKWNWKWKWIKILCVQNLIGKGRQNLKIIDPTHHCTGELTFMSANFRHYSPLYQSVNYSCISINNDIFHHYLRVAYIHEMISPTRESKVLGFRVKQVSVGELYMYLRHYVVHWFWYRNLSSSIELLNAILNKLLHNSEHYRLSLFQYLQNIIHFHLKKIHFVWF